MKWNQPSILGYSHTCTVKLDFDLGVTQYIRVEPIVEHPSESGIRYKAEVDEVTVNQNSTDATFPYYAEYSIELKAEPSNVTQITGSGWYKEGYTLRASAPRKDATRIPHDICFSASVVSTSKRRARSARISS